MAAHTNSPVHLVVWQGAYAACDAGSYSVQSAAENCAVCPPNSFSAPGADTCKCNGGYTKEGNGATLVCTGR